MTQSDGGNDGDDGDGHDEGDVDDDVKLIFIPRVIRAGPSRQSISPERWDCGRFNPFASHLSVGRMTAEGFGGVQDGIGVRREKDMGGT